MRRATRITASVLGVTAGLAGIEHGIFEMLQGNTRPAGLMIDSTGPPCVPEQSWNACEPALTILPSFWITGIAAVVLGIAVTVWSAFFVHRKRGGLGLILLSVLLLLFGGGIFPPVIGLIAGALGSRIREPLKPAESRLSGRLLDLLAALWPWSVVLYVAWVAGQWLVGYYFNDWLMANGYLIFVMVLGTLLLSVVTAYAYDLRQAAQADPRAGG